VLCLDSSAFSILATIVLLSQPCFTYAQDYYQEEYEGDDDNIIIEDNNMKAEVFADGLRFPTTMAFVGPNDLLVLEKQNGTVQRIINGKMLGKPLLDVNVANKLERGMLGIAVSQNSGSNRTYVFLYYTEAEKEDGSDRCPQIIYCTLGDNPIGNRLYRYELVNNELVNPKLLLDLPYFPGPAHNGGAITIGPDNNVYVVIGNLFVEQYNSGFEEDNLVQNLINGKDPDGRGGVLRVSQDGQIVGGRGLLGDEHPLDVYYAYGIRNSFGIDFDPVSGQLWDTENGPDYGDEINIVEQGFNSGWAQVQGIWKPKYDEIQGVKYIVVGEEFLNSDSSNLVNFNGKGKYSQPEFIWKKPVGATALKFFNSDEYGVKYKNDLFVGDALHGNVYHFDLSEDRSELDLGEELDDKIADTEETGEDQIVFGRGFGVVSDLEVGPEDGYLYIVSHSNGKIYRITPNDDNTDAS
jgi:aldose sugar dehydrogenase